MPHVVSPFLELDLLSLRGSNVLKQAALHFLRGLGVDRKVTSRTIPCGSLRIRPARQYRSFHRSPLKLSVPPALTARRQSSVFTQQRSTSATLQACATQPRGVNGGSASKISLIEPRHASPNWPIVPVRNERASVLFPG